MSVKLPGKWQHYVASFGGVGLFAAAFLDSSVLSFPFVMDILVIEVTALNRNLMPYYVAMTTAGSLSGAVSLYFLAKKGGEKFFNRKAGKAGKRIRQWVEKHGFLSVFIPAVLPPPFPFEPFIIAEGVLQAPLKTFVIGVLLGRGLRYLGEGMLAIHYGDAATRILVRHKLAFAATFIALCIGVFFAGRLLNRKSAPAT